MKRSAFSLVELLICLGIIGLLMAILLPVMAKAWGQSRLVTCASNLRQIGGAFQGYLADNNGWIPGSDISDYWWRYLGGCEHGTQPGTYPTYLDYSFNADAHTVWVCPFVPIDLESVTPYPNFGADDWSNHYALNRNVAGKPQKMCQLRNDLGLLADGEPITISPPPATPSNMSAFNGLLNYTYKYPPGAWSNVLAPWPINRTGPGQGRVTTLHSGGFNMAWVDGHVTTEQIITAKELTP